MLCMNCVIRHVLVFVYRSRICLLLESFERLFESRENSIRQSDVSG